MSMQFTRRAVVVATLFAVFAFGAAARAGDPLPSWNDRPTKQAIVAFVDKVTKDGSPDFVKPDDRIATFDNDGTLWVEQPIYTQVMFAFDRVAAVAKDKPELKDVEPFKAILSHDREAMEKFTLQDLEKIVAVTHSGMTV